jgi:TetR/AcrR family transcriptional repressor of uid operon
MRRANAQLQSDRRAGILAAAQRCFVRSGFHGASMQEICAEAGMSLLPVEGGAHRRHRRA